MFALTESVARITHFDTGEKECCEYLFANLLKLFSDYVLCLLFYVCFMSLLDSTRPIIT